MMNLFTLIGFLKGRRHNRIKDNNYLNNKNALVQFSLILQDH